MPSVRQIWLAAAVALGGAGLHAQTFEAASIVPAQGGFGIAFRFDPNRFVASYVTLVQLIENAYGVAAREVVGGPDWIRVERFNVTTTAGDAPVDRPRLQAMLRILLEQRFQLLLEREIRTGTVYTLTPRKVKGLRPPASPDMRPLILNTFNQGDGVISFGFEGHNATMAMLAERLAGHLGVPVTDRTGITGSYDFHVRYSEDRAAQGLQPDSQYPEILTAIEADLGLRLEAGRGPIPVYVVKRAQKPTPN